jgi:hypothetical protein
MTEPRGREAAIWKAGVIAALATVYVLAWRAIVGPAPIAARPVAAAPVGSVRMAPVVQRVRTPAGRPRRLRTRSS